MSDVPADNVIVKLHLAHDAGDRPTEPQFEGAESAIEYIQNALDELKRRVAAYRNHEHWRGGIYEK
jgi:hypothetical protein